MQAEADRVARWGTGVCHCATTSLLLCDGLPPVRRLRDAGAKVGIGCDGSSSNDAASMWLEARTAMLVAAHRDGPGALSAREALSLATTGSAACLGREGELGQLAVGGPADIVVWPRDEILLAGAHTDPVEALLRCGPVRALHTIVAGNPIVEDGELRLPGLSDALATHGRISRDWQAVAAR